MDDLGLEEKAISYIGIEQEGEGDSGAEESIGYDRLGSPDLFSSLGPTFYMSIGVFSLIFGFSLIAICVGRRMKLQEKNQLRLRKLEDSLFYNPLIRAAFLSGIKTNMVALLVFKLMPHN